MGSASESGTISISDTVKHQPGMPETSGNEEVQVDVREENRIYIGNKDLSEGEQTEIKLSDLKVVGALGQGASGFVQKCFHKPTQTRIALKKIPIDSSDVVKKQLLLELKTLHDCKSDYIVRSYGAFLKGGYVHIALEYMDAGSLEDIRQKVGTVPEDILGLMTIQILKGLEYLHKEMKVIHRDIKPSNILVNKRGYLKIADFGVSGRIDSTIACLSSWVGTMTHMSPERLKGEAYYADTDLWSVGLIILECAMGKFPFPLDADDSKIGFWEIQNSIETHNPEEPPESFSEEFRDFISIMLNKTPNQRSNCTDLLQHPWCKKYEDVDVMFLKKWIRTLK